MADDILPPASRRPVVVPPRQAPGAPIQPNQPAQPQPVVSQPITQDPAPVSAGTPAPLPINGQSSGITPKKTKGAKKRILLILAIILVVLIGLVVAAVLWYQGQLKPYSKDKNVLVAVTIADGETPSTIGQNLYQKHVIRSSTAFNIYARLSGTQSKFQAGTYRLSPGDSTQTIIGHIVKGTVDQFSVTFLPGATLAEDRQVLINAGYSAATVDTALGASYNSPIFTDKPAGTTLEGYIYGQTYMFNSGATVTDILNRSFKEYESVITANDLVAKFQAHGLNLYQGITLASIVQREVSSAADQKQVAQVFYSRLAINMPLGSDVTFIYAAKLTGQVASPTLDSPYNTRLYPGLPPGPISVPGLTALQAVANPAAGDYLYFLSGDDGKTYFANTAAEHQSNITNYCKVKCS